MTQLLVESFVLWPIDSVPNNPWSTIWACTLQLQVSTLLKCAVHAEEENAILKVNMILDPNFGNFEQNLSGVLPS